MLRLLRACVQGMGAPQVPPVPIPARTPSPALSSLYQSSYPHPAREGSDAAEQGAAPTSAGDPVGLPPKAAHAGARAAQAQPTTAAIAAAAHAAAKRAGAARSEPPATPAQEPAPAAAAQAGASPGPGGGPGGGGAAASDAQSGEGGESFTLSDLESSVAPEEAAPGGALAKVRLYALCVRLGGWVCCVWVSLPRAGPDSQHHQSVCALKQ